MTTPDTAQQPGAIPEPQPRFPDTPAFTGINRPMRTEVDIVELPYSGNIPEGLAGALYRCGPDPQFPPLWGDDIFINGDGVVSRYRIAGNHVDLQIRYVRTDKFVAERQARRALFGAYRNPWTDDPRVAGMDRTTANTTMHWHANRLFALKEDGLPHEVDPITLETLGKHDFDGRLRSRTATAHPKIDPISGEWVFFGYCAAGELTDDIAACLADQKGQLTHEAWLLPPYQSMIHDWAVTESHVVFPVMAATTDEARVRAGGPRWAWEPGKPTYAGIMPRGGSAAQVVWFAGPSCWSFHVMNAFSEGSRVHVDLCVARAAPLPDIKGNMFDPNDTGQYLTRWTFDLEREPDGSVELVDGTTVPTRSFDQRRLWEDMTVDFPEIDQRRQTRPYRHGFMTARDRSRPVHPEVAKGVWFNCLAHIDHETDTVAVWYVGEDSSVQEPVFVPRSEDAQEGDGWLLAVVNRYPFDRSELAILDTADISGGPIATVFIPLHLRPTFHGTWIPEDEMPPGRQG